MTKCDNIKNVKGLEELVQIYMMYYAIKKGFEMMKKVVGLEKIDYTSRRGERVQGTVVHYVEPLDERRGRGYKADNAFISTEVNATLGDYIDIYYNDYKKPVKVEVVKKGDEQ